MLGNVGSGFSNGGIRKPVWNDRPAGPAVPGGSETACLAPAQHELNPRQVINPGCILINLDVSVGFGPGMDTGATIIPVNPGNTENLVAALPGRPVDPETTHSRRI